MSEYQGIVATDEILGHSVMLQDYTDYYYLRVENDEGAGVLKTRLSRSGQVLKGYDRPPEDEEDWTWIRWAQSYI